jgi:DNA-binding MarR family transcriptional regulator
MREDQSGIAELDERIPFLLAQLGAYVSSDFQRRLAPIGAEPRTYAVLLALASADGQSQRQLSERLGIHRNAMVTVIDNLEQRGLAKRLPQPEDRRAVAVTLTAKARRLLPELHDQGRDLEDEIAAPLSTKDSRRVRCIYRCLVAEWADAMP